jgi:hypothetical protein
MEKEIFTIHVPFKGNTIALEIHATPPIGADNGDYQVWNNGEHVFTINPHLDVCDDPCWKVKPEFEGVDLEFASNVGMEIERHYL